MDEQLIALYHRHVAMAFDRQLRFADFLARKEAGKKWEYDVETATLSFGKLKFEAPISGSHAHNNNSWLWAWSNKNLKLTLTNRALGDTVRATVHRLGVHALAAPGFSLEPLLGSELTEHAPHILGSILSRELEFDAYYLTPYDGGCGLVLVRDDRLKVAEKHPLRRILTVFPQVISALPVYDHKAAFTRYAHDYGVSVGEELHQVKLLAGKDSLTATFDERDRLTKLEGTVQPEEPPAKKPSKKAAKGQANKKPTRKATPKPAAKKSTKKPAGKLTKKSALTKKPTKKPGKKR
ncbi:MAG: hypothetical protein L0241_04335 [Planctomycetia bacterium]|nr:hypothetical protein [Planctomycetia bacterium]